MSHAVHFKSLPKNAILTKQPLLTKYRLRGRLNRRAKTSKQKLHLIGYHKKPKMSFSKLADY